MSNILYGSSNVYRNFTRATDSRRFSGLDLQLVRCTKKTVFDSHLAGLQSARLIVTSVLENFITDVCIGVPDGELQLFAHQQLTAHVETLLDFVTRVSDVVVLICPPMYRSEPSWFGPYLPDFLGFLASEVSRINHQRIILGSPFVVLPSLLEKDGIHLTPAGGDKLLSHIDSQLQSAIAEAHPVNSAAHVPMDTTSPVRPTVILDSFEAVSESITELSRRTAEFESLARRRFRADDYVFARLKEEADAELNKSKEDRVVISGLSPPPLSLSNHSDKKKHYLEVVSRLVTLACASTDPVPKVLDVYVNLRKDQGQPLIEARFDSVSGASSFRREGVQLAKAEHSEFLPLFFANAVTQATRVRIEILKALAKKLSSTSETAFVQGFISRPVLQYRVKEGARSTAEGTGRGYNFVDAVARFGAKLTASDLSTAYVRAGNTFLGAMSQYFVVLKDDLVSGSRQPSVNRAPLGRRGPRRAGARRGIGSSRGARASAEVSVVATLPSQGPLVVELERGQKRPGDPQDGPSKRNDVTLDSATE